jgi:NTE family protein
LVADETFETVLSKNLLSSGNRQLYFEIVAQPKKSFKIDFGGNISSRPISNVYLGLQYNYSIEKRIPLAQTFIRVDFTNLFNWRSVDYPSGLPLFLAAELTYNHWNYYNTSQIFIENPHPTYIEQADRKIELNWECH